MVEVVSDQCTLCLHDRLFDGVELLSEIKAGSSRVHHGDDAVEVSSCPLLALCYSGVGVMVMHFGHGS